MYVVYNDKPVVARCEDILFKIVSAHRIGQCLGGKRMLGQVTGGPPMRYHHGPHSMGPFSSKPGKSRTSQRAVSSPRACRLRASTISRSFHSMCSAQRSASSGGV